MTTDPADQWFPVIWEDRIVWQDERHGNKDIYIYDLATGTETRLTTDPASQMYPAIWGDHIVWEDTRHGNKDIYTYNLATGTETRLTTDPADQLFPAIWGDRIVWEDTRHGNWDINIYDLSPEATTLEELGHSWDEPFFALVADVNLPTDQSIHLVEELTPRAKPITTFDDNPDIDRQFFFTYINISSIELGYLALVQQAKHSGQNAFQATAPSQVLFTHFISPNGADTFVTVNFDALKAYRIGGQRPGRLDPEDNALLGLPLALSSS